MRSARPCLSTLMRATASASALRSAASTVTSGQASAASTARLPLPVHRSSTWRVLVRHPGVERCRRRNQLGDQRARHDRALVDVERHALQPGFVRQVSGGLAGGDALLDQRCRWPPTSAAASSRSATPSRSSSGRPSLPQHQPGRFVEGVGRAMPKRNARLGEAGALALDHLDQCHVSARRAAQVHCAPRGAANEGSSGVMTAVLRTPR